MLGTMYNGTKLFLRVIILTIYVDVLITLNILVNYFLLLAVRKITRSPISRWRIALGSIVGGASSLLIFIEDLGIIMTLLKLLTAILMAITAFGIKDLKATVKKLFWLFSLSFIFGGLMLAAYIFFDTDILLYSNGIVYFDIDITFLVVCSVFSYIVISVIAKFTDKKAPKSQEYYTVIQYKGKTYSAIGLMDSGNMLREPFSNLPVVMVEKNVFKSFNVPAEKTLLIPVSTINGESLTKAFKPDFVELNGNKINRVYIGESTVPHNEYKIILNINLEGEMPNA